VSIIALVTGSWGFFATGFSAKTCERYHLVAPLTKRTPWKLSLFVDYISLVFKYSPRSFPKSSCPFAPMPSVGIHAGCCGRCLPCLYSVWFPKSSATHTRESVSPINLIPQNGISSNFLIALQDTRKNCISGNIVRVAWIHYLAIM
jgi:hypothetical protein